MEPSEMREGFECVTLNFSKLTLVGTQLAYVLPARPLDGCLPCGRRRTTLGHQHNRLVGSLPYPHVILQNIRTHVKRARFRVA
jgi:hypothetical protein